ncbi:MAG: DUF1566 domain-containing protein [Gammaproteobacteria bacterium]|nr:DUF1566 domain-containing protein [Gammaproteobacteria bacterium]
MKMSKLPPMLFSILSLSVFVSVNVHANLEQDCAGSTVTTADDEFTVSANNSGLVVHGESELMWSRCVVGQTWNADSETCDGEPVRLTWQLALQLSDEYQFNDHTDWRVPNLKELASLVERACVSPSANLTIFPNTPDGNFWTSTPNTSADKTTEAWSVAFSNGRIDSRDKQQDYYIRMVRYAE